jgi:hypothetical protein
MAQPNSCSFIYILFTTVFISVSLCLQHPAARAHAHQDRRQATAITAAATHKTKLNSYLKTMATQSESESVTVSPICPALPSALCDSCFATPANPETCGNWDNTCHESFCNPICLRLTWESDIVASCSGGEKGIAEQCAKLAKEVAHPKTQMALRAQFKAEGCARMVQCCKDDEHIEKWAEIRDYMGYEMQPQVPTPACLKEGVDREQLCSMCKAAITVTNRPTPENCTYFRWHEYPPKGPIVQVFTRSLVPAPQQIPKHKSFRTDCLEFVKEITPQLPDMAKAFTAKACDCLGCCDPPPGEKSCYYPVMYTSLEESKRDPPITTSVN